MLEYKIAQVEGTLAQMRAALEQAEATRDLAQVTWGGNKKLVKDGDQVILNPPVDLTDGHMVKVRPSPSAQRS